MQTRQVTRLAWLLTAALLWFTTGSSAYQVLVSSDDEVRQICSGMWGHGKLDPFIEGQDCFPTCPDYGLITLHCS